MKTKISFLVTTFVLTTSFVSAQSTDRLGPSCTLKHMVLSIPKFPQDQATSWCWAATAHNVMAFHDRAFNDTPQCEIVAKVNNWDKNFCCGNNASDCRAQSGFPESAFTKYEFSFVNTRVSNRGQLPLTWEEATEEICQNRPFISALDLTFGDRHSVIVTGYNVRRGVRIYDPLANDIIYESSADFFDGKSLEYERIRDTYNIQPSR